MPTMQIQTARQLELSGARVQTRNPTALWLIVLITLGIWGIVWWYQVNRELRDYSAAVGKPFHNSPVVDTIVMALYPLALVTGVITTFVTTRRVRHVQEWTAAGGSKVSAILAAILFVVFFLHVIYLQRALNRAWLDAESGRGARTGV